VTGVRCRGQWLPLGLMVEALRPAVAHDADGSLAAIGVDAAQAVADLDQLAELIRRRRPEQSVALARFHQRYLAAALSRAGTKASLA